MAKMNLVEVLNDPDVRLTIDSFAFESYCGSCDNFYDPIIGYKDYKIVDCPFEGKVHAYTEWEKIHCKNFSD